MMHKWKLVCTIGGCLFGAIQMGHAQATLTNNAHRFYVAGNVGIFQGNINSTYGDITDVIPQNIAESILQKGYTGGIALGYSVPVGTQYFLGAELSANMDSGSGRYQSGAATSAFTDITKVNNQVDLLFVPGMFVSPSIAAYIKLGVSMANLSDELSSPVGYLPVFTNYNTHKNQYGFSAGIGVKKYISDHTAIFTEYAYRDYGSPTFSQFTNFTANYTHSAHIYTSAWVLGAAYLF